ncbi:MAG: YcbK family protein [Woeseiaceae bacterium]
MNRIHSHGRRGFFKTVLAGMFASLASPLRHAHAIDERRLDFLHTHTGKRLDVTYKRNGEFVPEALHDINAFLQDFRTGERAEIDPELLDLIFDLREELGGKGTYEVISAYRSPKTNEMLRGRSSGVAKNSQHLLGKAIDVRLTGVELPKLRDTAIAMQRGGVGYYAKSNFIHVDTGRVRRW